jgi:predicted transcriptional regulator
MAWNAEKILTAIKASNPRECITEARLIELTGLNARQIRQSASTLISNGLMKRTTDECLILTSAGIAAVESGASANKPRVDKNTLRERIWRAIRLPNHRKFSVPEIVSLVVDENSSGDITDNVQRYIRTLSKAGFLINLPKREAGTALTSNGYKRYWLTDEKNTGPKAPIWRVKCETVFDQNTGEEIDISAKKESEAAL